MLLDIKPIRETPGAVLPFTFTRDLSEMDFFGEKPLREPVRVSGELYNRAGILGVRETVSFTLDTFCARCARPISVPQTLEVDQPLATELQDEENDDILLIVDDSVDAGEVAEQTIILNMDLVHLCRPDCRGLCPTCGADLNEGDCGCPHADEHTDVSALQ